MICSSASRRSRRAGRRAVPRCGYTLATRPTHSLELPLALTVTAAIVLIVANTEPLMGMSAVGRHASTTIIGGAYEMWSQGQRITGMIVAFCAVIAPASYILFMLTVLLAARRFPAPPWVGEMLRWAQHLQVWSMLEVMMLGILVALIKIAELAHGKSRSRDVCGRCTHDAVSGDHGDVRSARNLAPGRVG